MEAFNEILYIFTGARFNGATMTQLNASINLQNPPEEKIHYYFRSKLEWEKNKKKILDRIDSERGTIL